MPRTQIEIDIPDGYELARSTLRIPTRGELFIGNSGVALLCISDDHAIPRIIVRTAWQWPAWLKCDWVARNQNGSLVLGYGEHTTDGTCHFSNAGGRHYSVVDERAVDINLPPCTDWRQSLRLNPNREAKP